LFKTRCTATSAADRQPENGRYRESLQAGSGDTLQCVGVPAARIIVADLFA